MGSLTVSVVSHGHDAWLPSLLADLAQTGAGRIAHVILTHNLPAATPLRTDGWPFKLTEVHNARPAGFGANHNQAFAQAETPMFCVLNPDISLPDPGVWDALVQAANQPQAGCAYPVLRNPDGSVQDNARAVPTPLALFRRRLLRRADTRVDWASGAFWVVPSAVYRRLGGFDTGYFLYCEDVDFCLRLQLAGWRLVPVRAAHAVHHAQRSSLRGGQHLAWHVRSLLRLWASRTLARYLLHR